MLLLDKLAVHVKSESTLDDHKSSQLMCIDEKYGVIAVVHGMAVEFYYATSTRLPYLGQIQVRSSISAISLLSPGLILVGTVTGRISYHRYHIRATIELSDQVADAFSSHFTWAFDSYQPIQCFLNLSNKRVMVLYTNQPTILILDWKKGNDQLQNFEFQITTDTIYRAWALSNTTVALSDRSGRLTIHLDDEIQRQFDRSPNQNALLHLEPLYSTVRPNAIVDMAWQRQYLLLTKSNGSLEILLYESGQLIPLQEIPFVATEGRINSRLIMTNPIVILVYGKPTGCCVIELPFGPTMTLIESLDALEAAKRLTGSIHNYGWSLISRRLAGKLNHGDTKGLLIVTRTEDGVELLTHLKEIETVPEQEPPVPMLPVPEVEMMIENPLMENQQHSTILTTAERYKLPEMSTSLNADPKTTAAEPLKLPIPSTVTRQEYNNRIDHVLDQLETTRLTLKQMKHSFQLITNDLLQQIQTSQN